MYPFLSSARIVLRAVSVDDLDGPYLGWLNDGVVCGGNSHHVRPYTRQQGTAWISSMNGSDRDLVLAMIERESERHIGNVALGAINPVHRSAELSILLGEREYWGRGFGLEAARMLVEHGFSAMNLRRIGCGTFASNAAMRRLAIALGMREEGVRRGAVWKDGAYIDVVEFGLLREEFLKV